MKRFIGLDVGIQTTTIALVGPSGRQLGSHVVRTTARDIVQHIKNVPQPRALCMEEGLLAEWLYAELLPHVDELVIWNPMTKARGCKNDRIDAYRAAEAHRTKSIDRSVFKPKNYGRLRDLVKTQNGVTQDLIRVKNRLHSVYRARGVQTVPNKQELFDPKRREEWVKAIPRRSEWSAKSLFGRLDMLRTEKKEVDRALIEEAKKYPIYSTLISFPSIGPVRAAQLMAIVVSPHRFRTKRQFWAYCGLAIQTEATGEYGYRNGRAVRKRAPMTRGLRPGNAILKNVFKGIAMNIVARKSGEFCADYERLRADNRSFNMAQLTLARRIAATVLAMWKNKEGYSAEKHRAMRK